MSIRYQPTAEDYDGLAEVRAALAAVRGALAALESAESAYMVRVVSESLDEGSTERTRALALLSEEVRSSAERARMALLDDADLIRADWAGTDRDGTMRHSYSWSHRMRQELARDPYTGRTEAEEAYVQAVLREERDRLDEKHGYAPVRVVFEGIDKIKSDKSNS